MHARGLGPGKVSYVRSNRGWGRQELDISASLNFAPQAASGQHDSEFEDGIDVDLGNGSLAAGGKRVGGIAAKSRT